MMKNIPSFTNCVLSVKGFTSEHYSSSKVNTVTVYIMTDFCQMLV